ncbi:putative transcription factor cys6 [Phaeomoniella chlamydospora]|uniref:Putative transcription factor cys6 n=1 Tax=Phaeomoniella chlamydospora TaxID=158046 RepID=A0A0G2EZG5_PHACM|nr:putative transcription factor cys6 [Phaeomoniella chlamydospora]
MPEGGNGPLRTKTGCLTCRVRRVKCDETKPICIRCTKTGRHCDGYSSVPISRRELIARQFPDDNFTAFERKCFELFRLRTAKAGWELILQLSHLEPSIRHGILALGALHHECDIDTTSSLKAYDKAIQHTRSLQDPSKILAACVIFTSYENITGHYATASMHLRNGLAIANETKSADELREILHRFDFQAMTLADADNPYPWVKPKMLKLKIPYSFGTIKDARILMIEIQRWAMSIMKAYQDNDRSREMAAARDACQQLLHDWKVAFDRSKSEHWIPMPKLYWMLAMLVIGPGCEDNETAWDLHLDLLEGILNAAAPLARISGFSLELGTTVPLFTVATKCRDPLLRRRSIMLLRNPRQEGLWYSPAASKVAERIMQIEEGSGNVKEARDISEAARVRDVFIEFVPSQKYARARFVIKSQTEWSSTEEIISY